MGKTKYIDANELRAMMYHGAFEEDSDLQRWDGGCWIRYKMFENALEQIEPADVVEVVRCAECKYQDKGENDCEAWNLCGYRPWLHIPTEDDAFCSKGERKDG